MEIKRLALVLVDISGYTRFMRLHTMSLLHAEAIITELLEAVIDPTCGISSCHYPLQRIRTEPTPCPMVGEDTHCDSLALCPCACGRRLVPFLLTVS